MKKILSMVCAGLMILSTVSYAAPVPVATVDDVRENDADMKIIAEDDAAVTNEEVIIDENYGQLVVKIDFSGIGEEYAEKIPNNTDISKFGYITPSLPDNFPSVVKITVPGGTTLKPEKTVNETTGEITREYATWTIPTGKGGYGKFGLTAGNGTFPQGSYTFKMNIITKKYDGSDATSSKSLVPLEIYYLSEENDHNGTKENLSSGYANADLGINNYGFKTSSSTTSGTTYNIVAEKTYKNSDMIGMNYAKDTPVPFEGVYTFAGMYNFAAPANGDTVYEIDSIELYYKSVYTVTFADGGVSGVILPETIVLSDGESIDMSEYRISNTSEKLFNGWVDGNGKRIGNTFTPTADTTLTAVWENAWDDTYGNLIASFDFESFDIGTDLKGTKAKKSAKVYGAQMSADAINALNSEFPTEIYINVANVENEAVIAGDDTNRYLSLNSSGTKRWGSAVISANGDFPEGTYYLVRDARTGECENVKSVEFYGNSYLRHPYESTHTAEAFKNNRPKNDKITTENGWSNVVTTYGLSNDDEYTKTSGGNTITYKFMGVSQIQSQTTINLTAGASTFDSEVIFDNIKLYYKPASPETLQVASMRTGAPQGIRIAGFVSNGVKKSVDEYGFVIAREESFENDDYTSLTMANESITKVSQASYQKGSVDTVFIDARESTDEAKETFGDAALDVFGTYFTGVLVGIPEKAEYYTSKLVARTYTKIGDKYYYGEPVVKSVYEVSLAIKAKCENEGMEVPEYALKAISVVESANEAE